MLVRLRKTKRLRAGWFVALIYLLCVLAPSLSFALPGSHAIAPCLAIDNPIPGVVLVHNQGPAEHVHAGEHVHGQSVAHSHASSDGVDRSMSIALNAKQLPKKAPHSSGGQCCGLTCVTALPATLIDIAKPSPPAAVGEDTSCQKAADNPPAGLYRPPIS